MTGNAERLYSTNGNGTLTTLETVRNITESYQMHLFIE